MCDSSHLALHPKGGACSSEACEFSMSKALYYERLGDGQTMVVSTFFPRQDTGFFRCDGGQGRDDVTVSLSLLKLEVRVNLLTVLEHLFIGGA